MRRVIGFVCACGLWAGPVFAQELHLAPPSLTAHANRCTTQLRQICQGRGQRAIESDLSCDACGPPPMPPELVAPKDAASPGRQSVPADECLPRASGETPSTCVDAPRLDNIPRP